VTSYKKKNKAFIRINVSLPSKSINFHLFKADSLQIASDLSWDAD
jgi:hypothetical protein